MAGDNAGRGDRNGSGVVESAREWGVRQAGAAPPWSLSQLRVVAVAIGVRLRPDTQPSTTAPRRTAPHRAGPDMTRPDTAEDQQWQDAMRNEDV
jgi:hypothetical protein